MFVELFLAMCFGLLLWYYVTQPGPNYPKMPPIRLPFFGHSLYVKGYKNMQEAIMDLMEKYGQNGVLALHMGPGRAVFVQNLAFIKEAFKKEELNYRYPNERVHDMISRLRGGYGRHGIISSYERTWTEQRRFTLRTLREFGFGKSGMEEMINNEVFEFIPYIISVANENKNGTIKVQNLFNVSILNALWQIIAGSRYDYRNPELLHLTKMVNDIITTSGPKFSLGIIFPFLRKIFPKIDPFIENITKTDIIRDFVTKTIEEHEESFNPDEQPRDFIDVYFQEQSGCDPDSSFSGEIGRVNLINTLIDLFFAGSETTSSTLTWGILYLILNPDVQDRLRQEICQVVGTERQPKLGDRLNMPYTEAVIQEIQRLGNIAPFGLPHSTYKTSVIIGKYVIPKGHSIHAQLGGVMKSKASWGQDAQVFKPERFIKDEDSSVIRDERLIPFLVGKRQCPGETLAKAEIFLYLTGILQKLKFSVEDPENPPSPDNYVSGTTAAPNPFTAKIDII